MLFKEGVDKNPRSLNLVSSKILLKHMSVNFPRRIPCYYTTIQTYLNYFYL